MAGDEVTRQECTQSMERVHTRIDDIAKTATQIEISAKLMKESVDKMTDLLYGKGARNGVITKLATLCSGFNLQWKFIWAIIVGIFGVAFYIIRNGIK